MKLTVCYARDIVHQASVLWQCGYALLAAAVFTFILTLTGTANAGEARVPKGGSQDKPAAPTQSSDQPKASPTQIIRQGGYVEKVQPGVDYKNRLPHAASRSVSDSLAAFHHIPGVGLEVAAAEPLVCDPVDITFDEDGRMIVAELITYSERRDSLEGRVSVLTDTKGDGRYDRRCILVDKLSWPTGILWYDGGVFVANPPDLLYCKDTDGDGRADIRRVVMTGFDTSNPNECANSLRWNLDNRVEFMPATGGGVIQPVQWQQTPAGKDAKPFQIRGRDLSFDPRTGQPRPESGGSQYGMTFSDWGCKFESANSSPIEMIMFEDRYIGRNPFLAPPRARIPIWTDGNAVYRTSPVEPWRIIRTEMRVDGVFSGPVEGGGRPDGYFTAACGLMINKGGIWPPSLRGNAFVCEGASNLVHRMRLDPDGVAFKAHRTEQEHEFLTSDEVWFKPVQLHNGPDGALYVVDMYREIFEHPDAIPPSVRKYVDLNTGNDRGRVYRIVPKEFRQPAVQRLSNCSTAQLVAFLSSSDIWHRRTASRLLFERQDPGAVEPLQDLVQHGEQPLGRMHAMYALAGMHRLTEDVVLTGLDYAHPRVREHAVRLAEHLLETSPSIRAALYDMVDDPDIRVRYQLGFTLGDIPGDQATAALACIARRDLDNKWIRLAILSSSYGRAGDLLTALVRGQQQQPSSAAVQFLEPLAEQVGRQNLRDQVAAVIQVLEHFSSDQPDLAKAIVRGLSRGLTASSSPMLAMLSSNGTTRAGQMLDDLIATAMREADQTDIATDQRVQAIQTLAMAPFPRVGARLEQLLDSHQPAAVQRAAIRTLSRFADPSVGDLIIDKWTGFSPAVRKEAAEALFARPERVRLLLTALADKTIATSQLDPARLQFLQQHPDADLRRRAQQLLAGTKLARRDDAISAYHDVLTMTGDAARGKAVFKRECSQCHLLEGVGYDLGLPLQNVKTRGAEGILMQVLDPNREVNPAYLNYSVLTEQGRLLSGVITSETATSITLTREEGAKDTVLRQEIDELRSTNLSIMPEGLETKVNQQEMADLIAYLLHIAG